MTDPPGPVGGSGGGDGHHLHAEHHLDQQHRGGGCRRAKRRQMVPALRAEKQVRTAAPPRQNGGETNGNHVRTGAR